MLQHRTVLIIDDCATDRAVYRQYLIGSSKFTYSILESAEASGGLLLCSIQQIDVILIEFNLPDLNGLEFLAKLKAKMGDKSPPVIIITSNNSTVDAVKAIKNGAEDYLVKGKITSDELESSMQNAINTQAVGADITECKQIEIDLRLATERFELAAKAVNCIIYDWNLLDNTVTRTCGLTEILGYSLEEAEPSAQWWQDRIHPEDFVQLNRHEVWEQITKSNRHCAEYRIRHKDGHYLWLQDQSFVVLNDKGQAIRVVGSSTDITERKNAEEELRQKTAILSTINNCIPILIFVKDRQGRLVMANPEVVSFIGKPEDEIIGFTDMDFNLKDYDAQRIIENDRQVMETGQTYKFEETVESDEGKRTFVSIKTPYKDELGNIIGLIGVSTDISERKQAEREREELLAKAQAACEEAELANRTKDEFIAIVSHELRSPLNAIVGWTKLLRSRKFDQTTASRALETIERNTQAQLQLIEDLLDISRMIRGNLRLTVSSVNLATLVETTVNSFRFAAQEKKQQLETNIDTSSCKVLGDINRLQQIVSNLLSNAIKFTPTAGRIEISLDTVSSQHKQSISKKQELTNKTYAKIQVTDTGKGIKPDFLPYVFERFRQADNSTTRAKDGLGLGLAIVHHLVGLHGGNITAFSAGEGLGATFTVMLPLLGDEGDEGNEGNEGNEENEGNEGDKSSFSDSNCLSGVKVLIVDDEPDTREYIRIALSQFGAVVMATASAKEALAVLNQLQPNILVSDIGMPEEDGYMLLEMVRELTQYRQIPAIALTAYAKQEDRNRSFRAGFQLHITKPVEPVGLVTAIISLIER